MVKTTKVISRKIAVNFQSSTIVDVRNYGILHDMIRNSTIFMKLVNRVLQRMQEKLIMMSWVKLNMKL